MIHKPTYTYRHSCMCVIKEYAPFSPHYCIDICVDYMYNLFRKESFSPVGQIGVQQNKGQTRRTSSFLFFRCFTLVSWHPRLLEDVCFSFKHVECLLRNWQYLLALFSMFLLWIYSCFGGRVLEGYGMTESSFVISMMDEGDNLSGHVGSPNPACGELL